MLIADQVEESSFARFARSICDPHTGVGADGCVFVNTGDPETVILRIFNRDGSEAGMSGNGSRCACAFLHHHQFARRPAVRMETLSGIKVYHLLHEREFLWIYRSEMGPPAFAAESIPFKAKNGAEILDHALEVAGEKLTISALSVGNPQCVVFVDRPPQDDFFRRVGAALEIHPSFPERTNVSFALVEGPDQLRIRIWERGVGPTHSSGTGSCGAAVAAIRAGRVQAPVKVYTETGMQEVDWSPGGQISLTGWAEFIGKIEYCWKEDVTH